MAAQFAHLVPQDLHIHTTFSSTDTALVPEQTMELIARFRHAERTGVSDHLDCLKGGDFDGYARRLRALDLYVGLEISGMPWVKAAMGLNVDYYIYHCRDESRDYAGAELLLSTDKPVIIAHPNALGTDLNRLPAECLVEINNRYVWRGGLWTAVAAFRDRFRFVIGSDAHQPNWLNHTIARQVVRELGLEETLLFPVNLPSEKPLTSGPR